MVDLCVINGEFYTRKIVLCSPNRIPLWFWRKGNCSTVQIFIHFSHVFFGEEDLARKRIRSRLVYSLTWKRMQVIEAVSFFLLLSNFNWYCEIFEPTNFHSPLFFSTIKLTLHLNLGLLVLINKLDGIIFEKVNVHKLTLKLCDKFDQFLVLQFILFSYVWLLRGSGHCSHLE